MPVKWNRALFALLLTAISFTALSCAAKSFHLDPLDDDEDRPPIIVKNGSIDFLAVPIDGGPGTWEFTAPDKWRLTHSKNKKDGKHFDVSVLFGANSQCKDNGANAGFDFTKVVKLVLTDSKGDSATMEMVKPQGEPRTVQVTATSATAAGSLLTAHKGNGAYITQIVAYKHDDDHPNDDKVYTCSFDPFLATAIVFQRTK